MADTSSEKAFYVLKPPRLANSRHQVQSAVTGAAAAEQNIWTGLGANDPGAAGGNGKCMVTFEALAQPVYILFKTTTSAATVTTTTGLVIPAGSTRTFWLDRSVDVFFEHIAGGAGNVKWYISSPLYDGAQYTAGV